MDGESATLAGTMNLTHILKLGTSGVDFSTRLNYDNNYTQAELDGIVATKHGVTPEKAAAIGREYFLTLMDSATPRKILNLFGLLSVKPTSGGKSVTADGFHTAEDIAAGWAITMKAEVIRDWREGCTIEQVGEEGVAAPEFVTVQNAFNNQLNTYTALQNIHISGKNLRFDKGDATTGVFMQPAAGGAWTRLTTYGPVSRGNVYVLIPVGTTGNQRIKLINESAHETIYGTLLGG